MKCMHCNADMPDSVTVCGVCGKTAVPDGFELDKASGLYKITAQGFARETGKPINVVTWFDAATGKYAQEINHTEMQVPESAPESAIQAEAQSETGQEPWQETPVELEFAPEPAIQAEAQAETGQEPWQETPVEPEFAPEPVMQDAYETGGALQTIPQHAEKKKSHGGIIAAAVVLLIIAGICATVYFTGYYGKIVAAIKQPGTEDVTDTPQGAKIPEFETVEPVAPVEEAIEIEEPDEPEDSLDEDDDREPGGQDRIPLDSSAVNFYPEVARVNPFYTRAAQDENYIWFLPEGDINTFTELRDLMYTKTGEPVPLPVPNLWPGSNSIYSFALYEDEIIVCAKRPDIASYGFYRAGKDGLEDPELLFEHDEPAYMNIYGDTVYALFPVAKQLVEFNPKNAEAPGITDMPIESVNGLYAEYLPEFSVVDGYIYYGLSYQNGQNTEYERRSLDTMEKFSAFSPGSIGEVWAANPIWDADGNVYYGRYDYSAGKYSVKVSRPGGVVQEISQYDILPGVPPLLAEVGFKSLIAEVTSKVFSRKSFGTLDEELSANLDSRPYAVTRDYLVAKDGLYRISDFAFIKFEQSGGNDGYDGGADIDDDGGADAEYDSGEYGEDPRTVLDTDDM